MGFSAKITNRISIEVKRYQAVLAGLQKRDVSEADTVTVVNDMLADVCGYDKYHHVTGQYAIRGTYVDLAVKVDEDVRFLVEVKAVNTDLKDLHVKQAIDYAANTGIEWVLLTNGVVWRVYKVHFGKPIEKVLVCELDISKSNAKSEEVIECFGNLSRESFSKNNMADLLHQKQITNKFTIAAMLLSDDVLNDLRKQVRRLGAGVRVDVDYLRLMLSNEIIKRDLLDSDEGKAAAQNVRRLMKSAARKKSAADKDPEEKTIVAPVGDASSVLPRAVVTP